MSHLNQPDLKHVYNYLFYLQLYENKTLKSDEKIAQISVLTDIAMQNQRCAAKVEKIAQISNFWPLSPAVDRPVDHVRSREQLLSGRSTARSTGPKFTVDRSHPRVGWLQSVDCTVDRPSQLGLCAHLVHIGRPGRSTNYWSSRPSRSTARAWQVYF